MRNNLDDLIKYLFTFLGLKDKDAEKTTGKQIGMEAAYTVDGREKVNQVYVLSGEKMVLHKQSLGEHLSPQEQSAMAGKFFMEVQIGGRWVTKQIDKETYDRISTKWMNDRADDFCEVFGVDKKNYDFSGIGADFKGKPNSEIPPKGNAKDFFRGLDISNQNLPKPLQAAMEYRVVVGNINIDFDRETMAKIAGLSAADRQTYFQRFFKCSVPPENIKIFSLTNGGIREYLMDGTQLNNVSADTKVSEVGTNKDTVSAHTRELNDLASMGYSNMMPDNSEYQQMGLSR